MHHIKEQMTLILCCLCLILTDSAHPSFDKRTRWKPAYLSACRETRSSISHLALWAEVSWIHFVHFVGVRDLRGRLWIQTLKSHFHVQLITLVTVITKRENGNKNNIFCFRPSRAVSSIKFIDVHFPLYPTHCQRPWQLPHLTLG